MRCERFTLSGEPGQARALALTLRALASADPALKEAVAAIIADVRADGDAALRRYAQEHDGLGSDAPIRVPEAELEAARDSLGPELRDALTLAVANVETVARASLSDPQTLTLEQGQQVTIREAPVGAAAVYVPGGRAPYPSTVVMGVTAAKVAGVERIAVCAPGGHTAILGACALCGVTEVYRAGGAHAIAALALGTDEIERVDVIAGPGGPWVQEAKLQLCGEVGIDGYLGPSDVFVLATSGAATGDVVADLAAQAEHGPGTIVVAASDDGALLDAAAAQLATLADAGAVAALVDAPDASTALALAEEFAPEHLELQGAEAESLAPLVRSAGAIFVGSASGTAFGDYVAGSNHSLPTGGSARYASALSPRTFRRRVTEVRIAGAADELAPAGAAIARAEGFEAHARSMEARVRQNAT